MELTNEELECLRRALSGYISDYETLSDHKEKEKALLKKLTERLS